jgi:uncharacterized protein involved in exopolysaccharide biosynthesis
MITPSPGWCALTLLADVDADHTLCHSARQMRAGTGDRMNDTIIIERSDILARDEDHWLKGVWLKVRSRWWLVLALMLAGFVGAVVYLRSAKYTYTVELRVNAAESLTGRASGSSGLSSLAQLAGVGADSAPASAFRLYLEGLKSREVAEQLARDRVLMRTIFAGEWRGGWRQPPPGTKTQLLNMLGLRTHTWTPPDAARLQEFVVGNVDVVQSVKSPLVVLAMNTTNPKFGMRFLTNLDKATDAYLREKQQERSRSNIAYLSDKLRGVTFVEQRAALFAALSDEERQAMLANSRAPFAAEAFGIATASLGPTKPRQLPLLVGGLIGGLLLGVVLAVVIPARRPRVMAAADLED